jgi:ABC-type glycerol-3-phosphate transport system substrate-binding protein
MKKRMSRREFLILAGAAGGSTILAACTPVAPAEAPAAQESASEAPAAETVTITFTGWGGTEEDEGVQADSVIGAENYFIEPQETERCTYEGNWYGIGSCWVAPHIYYNADIFEQEGIDPPSNDPEEAWDWDHFLQVAQQYRP